MKPYLSIVIPTYNRADKLDRALLNLFNQEVAHESYEVIVVDDGSMDGTDAVLNDWKNRWSQLQVLHQKNSGQATARNRGINAAEGQVILLGQDDIYASPGFLKAHIDFHQSYPDSNMGCLGLTEWWPGTEVTPFMEWLTDGGPQFAYPSLLPNESVSHWYFYTSNLSLKAECFKENPFDEDFSGYGWEDIELGYRLMNAGLELIYQPQALAWHDHFMEASDLKKRMNSVGKGALLLEEKCPGIGVVPQGFKLFLLNLIGHPFSTEFLALLSPFSGFFKRIHWWALTKRYFLEGLRSV